MKLASKLIRWYDGAHRDLPWRRTKDPYAILVSEVMCQQTRVETVIPYYEKFLRRFPSAAALAAAPEPEVLALWSGLGYYSRARNLREAARRIVESGRFPDTYDDIRALPGAGPYTAAAVGSIAFDLPHAVVDGNVLRVVARVTADSSDIGAASTKARFNQIASSWLDRRRPGRFNQALMELGAMICLPRNPRCGECPLRNDCQAHQSGREKELPVKLRRVAARKQELVLLVVARRGRILMWQRPADSARMSGFWELPVLEQAPAAKVGAAIGRFRHTITGTTFVVEVRQAVGRRSAGLTWIDPAAYPLSTTARKALALIDTCK